MSDSEAKELKFCEVPDPLVASFIMRVVHLKSTEWQRVYTPGPPLWKFPLHLWLKRIRILLLLRITNSSIIATATLGCTDLNALSCYADFFSTLKRSGYPIEIRSLVARCLFALRARDTSLARPYDSQVDLVVPLSSLSSSSASDASE